MNLTKRFRKYFYGEAHNASDKHMLRKPRINEKLYLHFSIKFIARIIKEN